MQAVAFIPHSAFRIPNSKNGDVAQLVEAAVSEAVWCGFDSHRHHLHVGRSSAEGHDLGSPVRVRDVRLNCGRAGAQVGLISPRAGFDSQVRNCSHRRRAGSALRLISAVTRFDSWAGDCDGERGRVPQLVEGSGREPDCCGFDSHPGHSSEDRGQKPGVRKQYANRDCCLLSADYCLLNLGPSSNRKTLASHARDPGATPGGIH